MRFIILIIFCTIGFTASAQFWMSKPKPVRYSLPDQTTYHSPISITTATKPAPAVHDVQLSRDAYLLEFAEDLVMTEAKHNMRFRVYATASYNFSDLAALYIQQNRFSEAKWYLLQSTTISRQQGDTKHTLANLLALAGIKTQIGEINLAKLDLQKARELASAKGMQTDLAEIDKKINFLQTNKVIAAKAEMHYADAVEAANNKTGIN